MFKNRQADLTSTIARRAFALVVVSMGVAAGTAFAQPGRPAGSFSDIAKKVEPAVVSIEAKSKSQDVVAKGSGAPAESDDIMDFFRRQQRPVIAVGSGFIVDKSGYIMTNEHVIDNAAKISVKLESGEEFQARVVGVDEETDVAVLKIEAGRDLPFVKFGDSDKAEVGDWVLAVGSPFGLAKSVTAGIISQTRRETPYATAFQKFIQTDAAINRGNSGGPLVNMDGDVIGINSQIATTTGDYNGVGFALPSSEAASVYGQIVKNGRVRRGYLGAYLDSVRSEFARVYGLKETRGAIITDIRDKASSAAMAGLQVGDIIMQFDGQRVDTAQDLIARVAATAPDQAVTVEYLREAGANLERRTTSIKLGERPTNAVIASEDGRRKLPIDGAKEEQKPFGLTLVEITPTLAATYKLEGQKGLLVKEINPASFIADVKSSTGTEALGEGDLIQRINRVNVTDVKSFNDMVAKLKVGDPVVLHVVAYSLQSRTPQLKIVQFTVR